EKLHDKLESYLQKGNIAAIIYSNPNNPSWICLNEDELKTIGSLATRYDTIVLEDLAYFAMDFRKELAMPFEAPYQPSVSRYTDKYILLISASKAFSYAGQRIGVACISDNLYHQSYAGLTKRYGGGTFGTVFIHRVLYAISSGTSHSAQYALAAMMKAACDGKYRFLDEVGEYGRRAHRLKEIFIKNGFYIVYDKDLDEEVADGFYFTIGYPGMTGSELMKELIYYGISAISLVTTGSHQEGLRACVSFIKENQYDLLEQRLQQFKQNHPLNI
ncbi:MAG: aminotransferase class I/II-fold pyridoxal phosphate-dependent enzyme, partial [Bacteroidales bacterium]